MNYFLGLLAAVLGLITLIVLSIVELMATPWPVLVFLILATLWFSQRLVDRFNPIPVEGIKSPKSAVKTKVDPNPAAPPPNARYYRGQIYTEKVPAPQSPSEEKCYRGLKEKQTEEEIGSPTVLENQKPVLRYRGIKAP